jgi:hypothetical protein
MLVYIGNAGISLALVAAIVGGVALFDIARQDGSFMGRALGILFPVAAILIGAYLSIFHHWL